MKQLLAICGIIICLYSTGCKKKYDDTIIDGFVTDSLSGEPLHGVDVTFGSGVLLFNSANEKTITDINGYYRFHYDTPDDENLFLDTYYWVGVKKEGYEIKSFNVSEGRTSRINFPLAINSIPLTTIHQNYYNSDSIKVIMHGGGLIPISDSWTCKNGPEICPNRVYTTQAELEIQISIKRYKMGDSISRNYQYRVPEKSPAQLLIEL